jgi:hypothetical protein
VIETEGETREKRTIERYTSLRAASENVLARTMCVCSRSVAEQVPGRVCVQRSRQRVKVAKALDGGFCLSAKAKTTMRRSRVTPTHRQKKQKERRKDSYMHTQREHIERIQQKYRFTTPRLCARELDAQGWVEPTQQRNRWNVWNIDESTMAVSSRG